MQYTKTGVILIKERSVGQLNNLQKKLRSEKGATITFALLLFLVCAVLAVVIIIASTAAAGRMSGLSEADQEYYSVTSASQLLKDSLGDQSITIAEVKDIETTTSYQETTGDVNSIDASSDDSIYLLANELDELRSGHIIYDGDWYAPNYDSLENGEKLGRYFAFQYAQLVSSLSSGGSDNASMEGTLKLEVTGDNIGADIDWKMTVGDDNDGDLTFQVRSIGDDPFIQTASFEVDQKVSYDTLTLEEEDADRNRDEDQTVVDSRQMKKTSISWKLVDIQTVK